jgi:hypothetical protein
VLGVLCNTAGIIWTDFPPFFMQQSYRAIFLLFGVCVWLLVVARLVQHSCWLSDCYPKYASTSTGMALGDALQENKVLKTLNVANNSIDSVACLTICAGVLENEVAAVHVITLGDAVIAVWRSVLGSRSGNFPGAPHCRFCFCVKLWFGVASVSGVLHSRVVYKR